MNRPPTTAQRPIVIRLPLDPEVEAPQETPKEAPPEPRSAALRLKQDAPPQPRPATPRLQQDTPPEPRYTRDAGTPGRGPMEDDYVKRTQKIWAERYKQIEQRNNPPEPKPQEDRRPVQTPSHVCLACGALVFPEVETLFAKRVLIFLLCVLTLGLYWVYRRLRVPPCPLCSGRKLARFGTPAAQERLAKNAPSTAPSASAAPMPSPTPAPTESPASAASATPSPTPAPSPTDSPSGAPPTSS
jgi:hypothetical protein